MLSNSRAKLIRSFNAFKQDYRHSVILKRLKRSGSIRVAFIVYSHAVWKLDDLYKALTLRPRFDAKLFLCPQINLGPAHRDRQLQESHESMIRAGIPHQMPSLQEPPGNDIRNTFEPHIVFLTNPWPLSDPLYHHDHFGSSLRCYIPYSWDVAATSNRHYGMAFHRSLWRYYLPSRHHRCDAITETPSLSKSVRVVGYPPIDELTARAAAHNTSESRKPVVIWAPHHTLPGHGALLDWSTFLRYSHFMLKLAASHKDSIRFVFKPHPMLRGRLEQRSMWGPKQTDQYWCEWLALSNAAVHEGPYTQLFCDSDALIHDCGSFLAEYLATMRPCLFLYQRDSVADTLNAAGRHALSLHYSAHSETDIERFCSDVVLKQQDPLADARRTQSRDLFGNRDKSATESILDDWTQSLHL